MSWFGNIVSQLNEVYYGNRENGDPTKVVKMPHDTSAFAPGDVVFYVKNTGHGVENRYGTIDKVEDGRVFFVDNTTKKMGFRDLNSSHLLHCRSWIKPAQESGVLGGSINDYMISYVMSDGLKVSDKHTPNPNDVLKEVPGGMRLIVVWCKTKGYKMYYKWPDGEFVGALNVGAMHRSNTLVACKKGTSEPTTVYAGKYNASQYGVIPEEFQGSAVLKIGNKKAWNFKHVIGIGYICPWLKDMDAPWSEPGSDTVRVCNPFNVPEIRAKMAELGL